MAKISMEDNLIMKQSFDLALDIIKYCEQLEELRKFVIARQLLKSGTSIGANVREAQHAESKADFIHKLKIAMKETEETHYWLQLCESSENYPECKLLIEKVVSVGKILSKILITMKSKS
jgi:four helix bundle protein